MNWLRDDPLTAILAYLLVVLVVVLGALLIYYQLTHDGQLP